MTMAAGLGLQSRGRQRGTVLLVSLIMLVVLTLFAISAIRTGNVGFRIVGNQQTQKLMEAAAQQAMEQVISNLGNFDVTTVIAPSTTIAQRVCVNNNVAAGHPPVVGPTGSCTSGIQVDVAPVRCISSLRSEFSSLTQTMGTFDNVWEITATVTDGPSGAKATYHQGVKIRMLSNSCPGLAT